MVIERFSQTVINSGVFRFYIATGFFATLIFFIINADLFNLDINEYPAFIRNEINLVASKLESAFGIFKKDENENRLMIAEIYRELGDFENSIKTIDFYEFNSEYYIELALKIKEFSQNKDSEVKLLK